MAGFNQGSPKGYSFLLFLPRWNRHFWWRHREREADHHTRCIEKWHPVPTTRSSPRNWENQTNNARVCELTMVKCCAVCQESQTEHRQQPLLAQDVPSTPCTKFKVASDVFQIKGDNYLHTYISSSVFIGHSPVDRSYKSCLNFWLITQQICSCAGSSVLNIMCAQHMSRRDLNELTDTLPDPFLKDLHLISPSLLNHILIASS